MKTCVLRDFYSSPEYFIYGDYKSPPNVKKTTLKRIIADTPRVQRNYVIKIN